MTNDALNLEEYQHHIQHPLDKDGVDSEVREPFRGKAICGARYIGWAYVDIEHAFLSAPVDRMQPCPSCAAAIVNVFANCE